MILELPPILNIPKKLYPLITEFQKYKYFVVDGGRGSGKSQSICRLLLSLADNQKLRIVCGRETQNTIEESVYTILKDIISENELYYEVQKSKIIHKRTGSEFSFKGFREQGLVSIKGLEGVNILYVDEAQSISKPTLDVIIPTIRTENAKLIFTMNRYLRNDAVFETLVGRPDCLHIKINYDDNPHCPLTLKKEAEECRRRDERDYRHIWLGEPLDKAEEYLFNFDKLDIATKLEPFGEGMSQKVMSVDYAGAGGDLCVASLLQRKSNVHWELVEQRAWSSGNTDSSIGKTVAFNSLWSPDVVTVDAGGFGYPMYISLSKSLPQVIPFNGAKTELCSKASANHRAEGYLTLKEFFDNEWLIVKNNALVIKELEGIKRKFKANGQILMESKEKMRAEGVKSPDRADSLMMGVFAIRYFLHRASHEVAPVRRINIRRDIR